jgi:hypothetical protein
MEWSLRKTGAHLFDSLHTYGLGILLATAFHPPIDIQEHALSYSISCSELSIPPTTSDLLKTVLPLPGEQEAQNWTPETKENALSIYVLDGLLTALLTISGPRVLSLYDLFLRRQKSPHIVSEALAKVQHQMHRWEKHIQSIYKGKTGWIEDILTDYEETQPHTPLFMPKSEKKEDLSVLMTIDPFCGYALRSMYSDGKMTNKTNVAVHGTKYAALLAFLGASRFLRAHRLSSHLIILYVPCASMLRVTETSAYPLLAPADSPPEHTIVWKWISSFLAPSPHGTLWKNLSYQILQTQGIQQPLSLSVGHLDYDWLLALEQRVGRSMLLYWKCLLEGCTDGKKDEQDLLVEILIERRFEAWFPFLYKHAKTKNQRQYRFKEVYALMTFTPSSSSSLKNLLDREAGTLNFGRALRQLGRRNPSSLRDLTDLLEQVRSIEQLLKILSKTGQECKLVKAKWKFIIVPDEDDVRAMIEDIERHGVTLIAGMLIVLSAVRRPYSDDTEQQEEERQPEPDTPAKPPFETLLNDPDDTFLLPEEEKGQTHDRANDTHV